MDEICGFISCPLEEIEADVRAIERLLYRISISLYAELFVLKGAMLFNVWFKGVHRADHPQPYILVYPRELGRRSDKHNGERFFTVDD